MFPSKSLAVAALAAGPAAATSLMNVYWGQNGNSTERLSSFCDSTSIDSITLSFVNNAPQYVGDYPGTNFAAHCASDQPSDFYLDDYGTQTKLLSQCSDLGRDIKYCQDHGKKVLLSVGGAYSQYSNYSLPNNETGVWFADFLFNSFGPKNSTWTKPRPFDFIYDSEVVEVSVDGFDFDIETKFADQGPYIECVNHLHSLTKPSGLVVSAAPQCPLVDDWFQMKNILTYGKFDKIWIQYYNNEMCTGKNFNFDQWYNFFQTTATINKDAELYVGLLAVDGGSSGYLDYTAAGSLILDVRSHSGFCGLMLWDASYATLNRNETMDINYLDFCYQAMQYQRSTTTTSTSVASTTTTKAPSTTTGITSTTTSSTTISTTISSTTISTTISSTTISTSTSSTTVSTSTSSTIIPTTTPEAPSTTPIVISTTTSTTTQPPSTTTSASSLTTSTTKGISTTASSGSSSSAAAVSVSPSLSGSLSSSTPVLISTTTTPEASSSVTISAAPTSTGSYGDSTPTDSYDESTPTGSYDDSAPTGSYDDSAPTGSYGDDTTPTSNYDDSGDDESCEEDTETSGPYTGPASASVINSYNWTSPVTTSASSPEYTTSTVRATHTYTITSCASTVTNCPVNSVTTEVVDLYTTVCPVAEAEKATATGVSYTEAGETMPTATYPVGGSYPAGGSSPAGGSYPAGGSSPAGGSYPTGGSYPVGGSSPAGGSYPTGGSYPAGGSYPVGGSGSGYESHLASSAPGAQATAAVSYGSGSGSGASYSAQSAAIVPVYPTGKTNGTTGAYASGHSSGSLQVTSKSTAAASVTSTPAPVTTPAMAGSAKTAAFSLASVLLIAVLAL